MVCCFDWNVSPWWCIAIVGGLPSGLGTSCALATAESGAKIWCQWGAFGPPVAWAAVRYKGVVMLLFACCLLLLPLWGVCGCSMFCCTLLYVTSSFAIILMRKRELVALLSLSSWCLVIVVWLFLVVPWVCLQFVIVVFPDHTHYFLYFRNYEQIRHNKQGGHQNVYSDNEMLNNYWGKLKYHIRQSGWDELTLCKEFV